MLILKGFGTVAEPRPDVRKQCKLPCRPGVKLGTRNLVLALDCGMDLIFILLEQAGVQDTEITAGLRPHRCPNGRARLWLRQRRPRPDVWIPQTPLGDAQPTRRTAQVLSYGRGTHLHHLEGFYGGVADLCSAGNPGFVLHTENLSL